MLDIGWSELFVIGVVALIVVGPKDLPHLFHSLGRFTARARSMAREFTSAMEDAARSSGIDEAAGSLRDMKSLTSKKALGLDALDRAAERFEKWDPKRPAGTGGLQKDPGQPDVAGTGAGAAPSMPAGPVAAPASPPNAVPTTAPVTGDAPAGKRRLHAVRRSDMKDL